MNHSRRRRLCGRLGLAVLVVVVAAGCQSTTEPARGALLTLTGTMTVAGAAPATAEPGEPCRTLAPYAELTTASDVVVSNAAGGSVATGRLADPRVVGTGSHRACRFSFTVPQIPATSAYYGVTVGGTGRVTRSRAELTQPLALALGFGG